MKKKLLRELFTCARGFAIRPLAVLAPLALRSLGVVGLSVSLSGVVHGAVELKPKMGAKQAGVVSAKGALRSVFAQSANVSTYTPTLFDVDNKNLYLGASTPAVPADANAALLATSLNQSAPAVTIAPSSPSTIAVNTVPAALGLNPLTGNFITNMVRGPGNNVVLTVDPVQSAVLAAASAPWNAAGVAWSQAGGVATAAGAADPVQANNNAQATIFMVNPDNANQVLVTGGANVGLATASPNSTNNLLLVLDGAGKSASIQAIAATPNAVTLSAGNPANVVFAAVADQGKTWQTATADNRGVAVVGVNNDGSGLTPLDPTNLLNPAGSAKQVLITAAGKLVAFGADATLAANAAVDMTWSGTVKNLYVVQEQLTSGNTSTMGAVGIFRGSFDGAGVFNVNPIVPVVNLAPALFDKTADINHQTQGVFGGLGVNIGGPQTARVNLYLPRAMHTSTGKDYLLAVGGVESTAFGSVSSGSWVNALLLNPATGNLAQINLVAGAVADLDVAANAPVVDRVGFLGGAALDPANGLKVVVGADPRLIGGPTTNKSITNMAVVGDTVYAAVAGDRSAPGLEAGVFQSTALFDTNGLVRAWTPWTRIAGLNNTTGFIDVAFGFGADQTTGDTIWLGSDKQTVRSSLWGTSGAAIGTAVSASGRALSTVATANFTPANQGVLRVFNFDAQTPGFDNGGFSMTVPVGGQNAALVQMAVNNGNDNPLPEANFNNAGDGQRFFLLTGDYDVIAPITCVEVERANKDVKSANGFLYVGGANGLARMQNADGAGWFGRTGNPTLASLSAVDNAANYPSSGTTLFAFTALQDWNNSFIVAVAASGSTKDAGVAPDNNLHILALDKFVKTDNSATLAAAGNAIHTFDPAAEGFGTDLVVVGNGANAVAIIATTTGLFATKDAQDFQEIDLPMGMVPLQMVYLSQTQGVNSANGNLLVLAGNNISTNGTPNDTSVVYRFDVNTINAAGAPIPVTTPWVVPVNGGLSNPGAALSLGEFRRFMAADGAVVLSAEANATSGKVLEVFNLAGTGQDLTGILGLANTNFINAPVRDTASGGWIVPGDFGVFVNE